DGSTKYVIENPDSAIDYVDPEAFRRPSNLLIYENDVQVGGPIRLDTISCNEASDDGQCRSGGPCRRTSLSCSLRSPSWRERLVRAARRKLRILPTAAPEGMAPRATDLVPLP